MPNNKLLLSVLLFLSCNYSFAQSDAPSFYSGLYYLSDYLTSNEFELIKKGTPDINQVDSLYHKALLYFNYDVSEALLCLTFTCLPFNKIEIKMPLGIGSAKIPLPSPSQIIFEKRKNNLPGKLFFDSPKNNFGDKDKLSHFFGNAFLHNSISCFNLSKFMGIFVEITEENFFLNGGLDGRDLIANHLGELFSEMIKNDINAEPSKALLIYQLLFFRLRK